MILPKLVERGPQPYLAIREYVEIIFKVRP